MIDLYEQYISEREDFKLVKTDSGFATYKILGEHQCYLRDIFVRPEARRSRHASFLADVVSKIALQNKCTHLTGSVDPGTIGAHESMLSLLSYGFRLHSVRDGMIWFVKELK